MEYLPIIVPPLLMLLGGIITWIIKSRVEELRAVETKLREDRRKIYVEILDPFIILFSDIQGQGPDKAVMKLQSYEYRKTSLELNLFGSDNVVRAYNNFMSYTYEIESSGKSDTEKMMRLWGGLLLAIRKSLGNKKSELNEFDMLRAMIKDIDTILQKGS